MHAILFSGRDHNCCEIVRAGGCLRVFVKKPAVSSPLLTICMTLLILFEDSPKTITPEMITSHLMTTERGSPPQVDMLIRTSGVTRLSDYMLWQVSHQCVITPQPLKLAYILRLMKVHKFISSMYAGQISGSLTFCLYYCSINVPSGAGGGNPTVVKGHWSRIQISGPVQREIVYSGMGE